MARSSDGAMNLQNLPYTYGIKNIFTAPPGWEYWEADYSQIELRFAGEFSKDKLLLYAFQNGKDLHSIRAARIVGMDEETWEAQTPEFQKDKRKKAKPVNFGYLYGMSWRKFIQYALTKYDIVFTDKEAAQVRDQFFADHADLPEWYDKMERFAKKHGYVETITGRRRRLPNIRLDPDSSKEAQTKYSEARRQAINSPVQGSASELKAMAMVEIDERLPAKHILTLGEVHDSIVGIGRPESRDEFYTQIRNIMKHPKILDQLGIHISVPIEVDLKYGPSLGEMKEYV